MVLPLMRLRNPEKFKVPTGLTSGPLPQVVGTELWVSAARYEWGWSLGVTSMWMM